MTLRHVRLSLARFNAASKEADKACRELISALRAAAAVARQQEEEESRARPTRKRLETPGASAQRVLNVIRRPYTH